MSNLILFEENNLKTLEAITGRLSKSSIVPYAYRGKPAEIFSVLCLGQEIGIGPMESLIQIYCVNGIPTLSTKLKWSLAKARFPSLKRKWVSRDLKNLSVTLNMTLDDDEFTSTWDIARAAAMGLVDKKGSQYKTQALTMLQWRCMSECLNFLCPSVGLGLYTKEELVDFNDEPVREILNEADELERDHPRPENEKEIGSPEYRIMYGKFRNKQLKDVEFVELEERVEYLEHKLESKGLAPKYQEELNSIVKYIEDSETNVGV